MNTNQHLYLSPTYFLDFQNESLADVGQEMTKGHTGERDKAIALYYAVRDGWRYNPYLLDFRAESLRASHVFQQKEAHCVNKAILLAALLRQQGIASRMHFYQVRNHLGTSRLEEVLRTNVLVFHGATEVYLGNQWITITPAFNKALCTKLGVEPLEFDGEHEAIFQNYDREKGKFMEYLHDYGPFHDLPYELMLSEFRTAYGPVLSALGNGNWEPLQIRGLEILQS
ncbi:MAG: transglutaminase family protein [Bacteroidia bacterium]|nr:transglutaminase family protein [Bacteroidia bacterium]